MELDKNFIEQAQNSLISYLDRSDELSKDHVELFFEQVYGMADVLGPLCSNCENAEPNIDIVDNTMKQPWWYLVNISCRCSNTCKEYLSYQAYFNAKGEKVFLSENQRNERYPGNIVHKASCVHFSPQNA